MTTGYQPMLKGQRVKHVRFGSAGVLVEDEKDGYVVVEYDPGTVAHQVLGRPMLQFAASFVRIP